MFDSIKSNRVSRIFTFTLCISLALSLYAKPRTLQQAQQIANGFTGNTGYLKKGTRVPARLAYTRSEASQPLYYVFNKDAGFVIVSADDRAPEILGYSDSGSFDIDSLPDNFRFLLGSYATELEALAASPEVIDLPVKSVERSAQATGKSVAPLLGSILWDQSSPYNDLCPVMDNDMRTAVGCVATAMAQIMGYHQWPKKGTGTIPAYTTTSNGFEMPETNIENTYYDWEHITPIYNNKSTAEEKAAIAPLMYHCGLSVRMDYGYESGAYSIDVPIALRQYFDYNENMAYLTREYYTKAEWDSIIRHELDENRPVYYSGSNEEGGHAFVCDGYDTNGLFHINWGWSGLSNGYFILSNLTPLAQGTGGSSSGYNRGQAAVVGIQPQDMPVREEYEIQLDTALVANVEEVGRDESFLTIFKGLWNRDARSFSGYIGVALCNQSGEIMDVFALNESLLTLDPMYGFGSGSFIINIPESVPDGRYRLYVVYRVEGETDYHFVRTPVNEYNYMNMTVSGDKIYLSGVYNEPVNLQQDSFEILGNLYSNREGKFRYTVTNHGDEYVSGLILLWRSAADENQIAMGAINPVVIASGETQTFEISETVPVEPGEYDLMLMCDYYNSIDNIFRIQSIGDIQRVTVHETPAEGTPDLQLLSPLRIEGDNDHVNRADIRMTARITNKGAYFDNSIAAFIFSDSEEEQGSLGYLGYQKVVVDTNEEVEVKMSDALTLGEGTYLAVLYYLNGFEWVQFTPYENSYIYFTLGTPTGLNEAESDNLAVYPNPVQETLYVRPAGEVVDLAIYDLSGRELLRLTPETDGVIQVPVADLQAGTYLLRVRTNQEVKTTQFIKK